jgi:uncharacterized SAM-binding protein YcdF (DUF218 family)
MVLLVTDVFVLLTQVLLWVVVGLFTWYVLLRALPRVFLGGLVLLLLLGTAAFTFFRGSPEPGLLGDIWRIIAVPFSPLGLILILLLIVLSATFRGGLSKTGLTLLRVAIPLLLILSLPVVANFLAQRAELEALQITRPAPAESLPAGARRVIVVLGQDTTELQLRPRTLPAPTPSPTPTTQAPLLPPNEPLTENAFTTLTQQPIQLTEKGDRLLYTITLYREEVARGTNPLVVISAGSRPGRERQQGDNQDNTSEAEDISTFLQAQGIPAGSILRDNRSETVHDSAVNVQDLLQRETVPFGGQLFLVTSAIEMSRAASTFAREFANQGQTITVIPRPTDFQTLPPRDALRQRVQGRDLIERGLRLSDFLPSIDAFALSSRVISEYITSIYYFLRGWIRPVRTI